MKKMDKWIQTYTLKDMEWAFNEGIREGKNREYYSRLEYSDVNFSPSDLEYYMKFKNKLKNEDNK